MTPIVFTPDSFVKGTLAKSFGISEVVIFDKQMNKAPSVSKYSTLTKMIIAASNCDSTFDSCKYSIQRLHNIKLTLLKYNVIFMVILIYVK